MKREFPVEIMDPLSLWSCGAAHGLISMCTQEESSSAQCYTVPYMMSKGEKQKATGGARCSCQDIKPSRWPFVPHVCLTFPVPSFSMRQPT